MSVTCFLTKLRFCSYNIQNKYRHEWTDIHILKPSNQMMMFISFLYFCLRIRIFLSFPFRFSFRLDSKHLEKEYALSASHFFPLTYMCKTFEGFFGWAFSNLLIGLLSIQFTCDLLFTAASCFLLLCHGYHFAEIIFWGFFCLFLSHQQSFCSVAPLLLCMYVCVFVCVHVCFIVCIDNS